MDIKEGDHKMLKASHCNARSRLYIIIMYVNEATCMWTDSLTNSYYSSVYGSVAW